MASTGCHIPANFANPSKCQQVCSAVGAQHTAICSAQGPVLSLPLYTRLVFKATFRPCSQAKSFQSQQTARSKQAIPVVMQPILRQVPPPLSKLATCCPLNAGAVQEYQPPQNKVQGLHSPSQFAPSVFLRSFIKGTVDIAYITVPEISAIN